MSKIAVIANSRSRSSGGWAAHRHLFEHDPNILVYALGDTPLDEMLQDAYSKKCDTIVAAGGDGTISSVVDAIMRLALPVRLGVLPVGTFNHFAKDLHIPLEIQEAKEVLTSGRTIQVDVAKVNDLHFINNSSIGLYPYFVRARHALEKKGAHKWVAFIRILAAASVRRFSFVIHFGKKDVLEKTASSIFVGNNAYIFEGLSIGARDRLDDGSLFIAILRRLNPWGILRLMLRSLRGDVRQDKDLDVIGLHDCVIDSPKGKILVAYDGEVKLMTTPLRYSVLPKALRVIVPAV